MSRLVKWVWTNVYRVCHGVTARKKARLNSPLNRPPNPAMSRLGPHSPKSKVVSRMRRRQRAVFPRGPAGGIGVCLGVWSRYTVTLRTEIKITTWGGFPPPGGAGKEAGQPSQRPKPMSAGAFAIFKASQEFRWDACGSGFKSMPAELGTLGRFAEWKVGIVVTPFSPVTPS